MECIGHLTEQGIAVWLDTVLPVPVAGEGPDPWLAASGITGAGPSLPASRSPQADPRALWAFADADPLRSLALARSARLVERLARQLAPVHAATAGANGLVGFPAPPDVWADPRALVALALRLGRLTEAANVVIGLPFNAAGLLAAEELVLHGGSICIGPVFSPWEYRRAGEAYLRGLERRLAAGGSLEGLASVAWVPVTEIDDHARRLR